MLNQVSPLIVPLREDSDSDDDSDSELVADNSGCPLSDLELKPATFKVCHDEFFKVFKFLLFLFK